MSILDRNRVMEQAREVMPSSINRPPSILPLTGGAP
ncbi:hypothetical protein Ddep01_02995 [Deinococcus depolymerans]